MWDVDETTVFQVRPQICGIYVVSSQGCGESKHKPRMKMGMKSLFIVLSIVKLLVKMWIK